MPSCVIQRFQDYAAGLVSDVLGGLASCAAAGLVSDALGSLASGAAAGLVSDFAAALACAAAFFSDFFSVLRSVVFRTEALTNLSLSPALPSKLATV